MGNICGSNDGKKSHPYVLLWNDDLRPTINVFFTPTHKDNPYPDTVDEPRLIYSLNATLDIKRPKKFQKYHTYMYRYREDYELNKVSEQFWNREALSKIVPQYLRWLESPLLLCSPNGPTTSPIRYKLNIYVTSPSDDQWMNRIEIKIILDNMYIRKINTNSGIIDFPEPRQFIVHHPYSIESCTEEYDQLILDHLQEHFPENISSLISSYCDPGIFISRHSAINNYEYPYYTIFC